MPAQTVLFGPYRFLTLADLEAIKRDYIVAAKSAGNDLQSAAQNGQSFTFGPRRDWSLEQWGQHLAGAFEQLAPGKYGPPDGNRSGANFC